MNQNQKILEICGDSDIVFDPMAIGSDPNFVFQNDSNFKTLTLYDLEGNVINVNSWLECANYVNGGWGNSLLESSNLEQWLFFTLFGVFVIYNFGKLVLNRRKTSIK